MYTHAFAGILKKMQMLYTTHKCIFLYIKDTRPQINVI